MEIKNGGNIRAKNKCRITRCWPNAKENVLGSGKIREQGRRSLSGSVVNTSGKVSHSLIREGSQPVHDISIISRNSPPVSESPRIDRLSIFLSI